jgi:hypothetical protein
MMLLLVVIHFFVRPDADVVVNQPGKGGDKAGGSQRFQRPFPQVDGRIDAGSFGRLWYSSGWSLWCSTYITCVPPTPCGL